MAVRPIDGNELVDTLKQIISDYTSHGMYPSAFPIEYAIEIVEKMPTLTPPNEPPSCVGCDYLDEQCAPCAHCIRARRYADYYRRPPEGEEDT